MNTIDKDKLIAFIEKRIESEYTKHHGNLEWRKIAALKIYDELYHLNALKSDQHSIPLANTENREVGDVQAEKILADKFAEEEAKAGGLGKSQENALSKGYFWGRQSLLSILSEKNKEIDESRNKLIQEQKDSNRYLEAWERLLAEVEGLKSQLPFLRIPPLEDRCQDCELLEKNNINHPFCNKHSKF